MYTLRKYSFESVLTVLMYYSLNKLTDSISFSYWISVKLRTTTGLLCHKEWKHICICITHTDISLIIFVLILIAYSNEMKLIIRPTKYNNMTRNMLTIKEQDEFLLIIFNRLLMGFKWFNGSQFIKPNTLSWQFLIILQFGKFGG